MPCVMAALLALAAADPNLPTRVVDADNAIIERSCRVEIPPGAVIVDADGDGVIHIAAPDIVVDFTAAEMLRGAAAGVDPNAYAGVGVRINGHANVTLRGLRVSGYRLGVWASDCDGLTIEDCDGSDQRRDRLYSDPFVERGRDWLSARANDDNEWQRYGAAFYVEDARDVVIRRCKVRHSQNGLIFDRVDHSRVYDNDFSFNSGWGMAMWRSSHNAITRNAFDFCVRGYSHGVYNRGQDSAGLLMFEQNCHNVVAQNSMTHGGDGVFGFAGHGALGRDDANAPAGAHRRLGNNDNLFLQNDLSYAPAHGFEMTFSFGNRVIENRMVENAICGVWAGYSQDTLIAGNEFVRNGETGYGHERGGVNIEYGQRNQIVHNRFVANACGVHLWRRSGAAPMRGPWIRDNLGESDDTLIAANVFTRDELALDLHGPIRVTLGPNQYENVGRQLERDDEIEITRQTRRPQPPQKPNVELFGETQPVGAREHLRGREHIIMTEWGPWDHASPLVRLARNEGARHVYALRKLPSNAVANVTADGASGADDPNHRQPHHYVVSTDRAGVTPYELRVDADGFHYRARAALLNTTWQTTLFDFDPNTRDDPNAWRAQAQAPGAKRSRVAHLHFIRDFSAIGGPIPPSISYHTHMDGLRLGLIATTEFAIPAGRWRFRLAADSGFRLLIDGRTALDQWDGRWWGPRYAYADYVNDAPRTVQVVIEQFQQTRPAVLSFDIVPME